MNKEEQTIELARLERMLGMIKKSLQGHKIKLADESFLRKAQPAVIQQVRQDAIDRERRIAELELAIAQLRE